MILENDGVSECLFASVDTPIYEGQSFTSNKWGRLGARDLIDENFDITQALDGQFAALVDDLGVPVSCCQLEVHECNPPAPDQN